MTKSSLPKGWCLVKFGDLAESITERVDDPKASGVEIYVGLEHLDSDTTKISRYGTPDDVESTKLRFYPGDVIYARRRAYQRKLGVAEVEGICSAHALVLRARPDVCLREFLPYFLQSNQFHDRALSISVGSLSPTINWKTLEGQEFVLPPIAEQRRIVEALLTVDEAVHLSRASNTDELKISLVHSLFDNEVYTRRHLADFSEISIGGIWGSAVGEDEVNVEIVRQTEFCDNATIALGSGEIRSISKSQLSNRQLIKGDILIQKSAGTPTLCGRVVRITSNIEEPVVCSNFLHMFRVQGSADVADFVFWSLWYLHRVGKVFDLQRGTSIRNLDMGRYLKQTLPALSTSDLKDFVTQIRSIDDLGSKLEIMQSNLKISAHLLREHLLAGKNV